MEFINKAGAHMQNPFLFTWGGEGGAWGAVAKRKSKVPPLHKHSCIHVMLNSTIQVFLGKEIVIWLSALSVSCKQREQLEELPCYSCL